MMTGCCIGFGLLSAVSFWATPVIATACVVYLLTRRADVPPHHEEA